MTSQVVIQVSADSYRYLYLRYGADSRTEINPRKSAFNVNPASVARKRDYQETRMCTFGTARIERRFVPLVRRAEERGD